MIAVITGAGRRLGYELAKHLLNEGWQVIGSYRTHYPEVEELEALGADMTRLELTDLDAVDEWIQGVVERYPHISLLVHNASAFTPTEADPSDGVRTFEAFFQIHMQVPYLINERCVEALQRCPQTHGNIIHITDITVQKPEPQFRTYCATKAGLQSLNDSYAQALAPKIRVNAILPGPLEFLPEHSEAARKKVLAATPLQTMGGFQPVVQTVDYILQNDYLTGASIRVDGGRALTGS